MFGRHNCEKKPEPGSNYEKSPCATCRTRPPPESHYREDPGGYQRLSVQHPSMKEPEIVATGRSDLYPAIMRIVIQSGKPRIHQMQFGSIFLAGRII